ncbi:follicle cell protein 3C-1 isoform X2 [Zootermopsis nevadensis]|uniref:Follicle cell protein 3C-1 n=2 Tax=Zootermopsis nevadensis TaxID=136037 RepID=A0A067RWY4_ZOONE|nr:follicle cell protein 3C-1 isoform X2 [Zootermopsis nevadensis]KDR24414.1 Follicle cell protein 3C-1 [Zootermopsis nevadensis]
MRSFGHVVILVAAVCVSYSVSDEHSNALDFGPLIPPKLGDNLPPTESFPCVCGVFLTGQFVKGSRDPPRGNAALLHENSDPLPCNPFGNKQCTNKCLDLIVKHLPNSAAILCGSIDRDCHKERAYLFIKNCNDTWINTNLSAGREYCCKDGKPYKCPILS